MPVRFQVDPDFYDHPKAIGMSDAATALWVRAGSYSAAKLTDGFIAEHVLVMLSRAPEEAADELVRRGLWKRSKGGYRFHEWSSRNLTKARVEADRKRDRESKRKRRNQRETDEGKDENEQANPEIVRPDSGRNRPGVAPESNTNRPLSVSVSGSMSVSGSKSSSTRRNTREDDDDQNQRIEQKITDLLHELTGRTVPPDWAARIRRQLLDGRDVEKPIAYITRSISARPGDFLPTSTLPPPTIPVPPLPPVGERDNTAVNSRGRALVDQARAQARMSASGARGGPEDGR
ncbi:hypothetical protein ACFY05_42075 [Microtetraspora fusca]|uniref:DUF1376 domain-containing protein n=1 Tax=Microtetraspora fusca TaxID=1997 RepID=A0ABW6VNP1_MICFU